MHHIWVDDGDFIQHHPKWWFRIGNPANHTVDETNPANQLRLVVDPIISRVLAPSQVVAWDFWTINSIHLGVKDYRNLATWRRWSCEPVLEDGPGIQSWMGWKWGPLEIRYFRF